MSKHAPPATLQDVAARCGVSKATASKAFNPRAEDIGAATRERVLAAARELGFRRDRSTSLRAQRRWQNVGLAWGRLAPRGDGIYAQLCEAIALTINHWGYHLLFTPVADVHDWRLMQRTQRLDGVLVVETMPDAVLAEIEAAGYPAVLINLPTRRRLHQLLPDDRGGAESVVDHLVQRGHRALAYLPRVASSVHPSEDDRWAGVSAAAARHGVTVQRMAAVAAVAAAARGTISAAISYSQFETTQTLGAARAAGLDVPGRLALASCSDVAWLEHVHPPVTALDIPIPTMARQGAHLLVDLIEGLDEQPPRTVMMPETLVVRASTPVREEPRR